MFHIGDYPKPDAFADVFNLLMISHGNTPYASMVNDVAVEHRLATAQEK